MRIFIPNNEGVEPIIIMLDKKEAGALIDLIGKAFKGEKPAKSSNAYKIGDKLDRELPIF